jgi:hypothetical protein
VTNYNSQFTLAVVALRKAQKIEKLHLKNRIIWPSLSHHPTRFIFLAHIISEKAPNVTQKPNNDSINLLPIRSSLVYRILTQPISLSLHTIKHNRQGKNDMTEARRRRRVI